MMTRVWPHCERFAKKCIDSNIFGLQKVNEGKKYLKIELQKRSDTYVQRYFMV